MVNIWTKAVLRKDTSEWGGGFVEIVLKTVDN